MICFLDLDGTLVDFCGAAQTRLGITQAQLDELPKPWSWDFIFEVSGVPPEDFWPTLDAEFWATLPWTPDGRAILDLVEGAFDQICLISKPTGPGSHDGKQAWIAQHIPRYNGRALFGAAKHYCAGPGRYLIDDSETNINEFYNYGGRGILVPRPWNSRWMQDPLTHLRTSIYNPQA
jgi:hypothetical protein